MKAAFMKQKVKKNTVNAIHLGNGSFVETIPFHHSGSGKCCQKGKENAKYIWIWWDANSRKVDSIFLTCTSMFLSFWFVKKREEKKNYFKDKYLTKKKMIPMKKFLSNFLQFIRNFEERERLTILIVINMREAKMLAALLIHKLQRY